MKLLPGPGNGRRTTRTKTYRQCDVIGLGLIRGCSGDLRWERVDKEFGAERGILKQLVPG